jgi:serine/threonine-protein phosphatase 4 regulatory subunit 1
MYFFLALEFISENELWIPLGRLDKYAASKDIFQREMAARILLDTLSAVSTNESACISVLERISSLAEDPEPIVRTELMEQVPHIALYFQENWPSLSYAFTTYCD